VLLDKTSPYSRGALAIIGGNNWYNAASQLKLRNAGVLSPNATPLGVTFNFVKNGYIETEVLPAIGTQTFVEFWYGYPATDPNERYASGSSGQDPGFLTGSSANMCGIFQAAGSRYGAPQTQWGCVYNWNAASISSYSLSNEVLPPGVLAVLVIVRRQTGTELWRNGRLVNFIAQSPISYPAQSLICGSFVEDVAYWSSSNNTLLAGRIIADWSPAQVQAFSANPFQLFQAQQRRLLIDSPATGGVSGSALIAESPDTASASGTVTLATITGVAAVSEGVDTLAASGSTGFATITGTLARSEGIDTLVAAGAIGNAITGSLTVSEGIDIGLAAGTVTNAVITASLAASEGSDTLTASGSLVFVPITGVLARSEAPDTLMALGGYAAVTGTVYYRYMRQSKTKIVHYEQE
jgi:hypothetical protein